MYRYLLNQFFVSFFFPVILPITVFLFQYFPCREYLHAYNPEDFAKVGDVVLIKKMDTARKIIETHKITEVIYSAGFVIDPMTGIRVDGDK